MFGATFWKLLGLGLTALLGVVGTFIDPKEKTEGGKRRPIGLWVAAGIVASALVGGYAQIVSDRNDTAVQGRLSTALARIAELSNRTRFSGQLRVEGTGKLSLNDLLTQPLFKQYNVAYDKYERTGNKAEEAQVKALDGKVRAAIRKVLDGIQITVNLPEDYKFENPSQFRAVIPGSAINWNLGEGNIGHVDSVTMLWSGVPDPARVQSKTRLIGDFCNREVHIFTNAKKTLFDMDHDFINLIDDMSHSKITRAKIQYAPVTGDGAGYYGQTEPSEQQ